MKKFKEILKKVWEFIKKHLDKIIIIGVILILILNIFNLNKTNPDISKLEKTIEEQRKKLDKKDSELQVKIQELKNKSSESELFRQKGIQLLNELKSAKNDSNFNAYLNYFTFASEFSIFNENFAKENEQTYIMLTGYYNELVVYDNQLKEYKKAVDTQIYKLSVIPYVMGWKSDKFYIGGGIDLRVPINYKFAIIGGVGYYNQPFVKIGIDIKF